MKCSVSGIEFISVLLLYKAILYYVLAITYVVPTKPLNSPCPSPHNGYFTLNEWIESGTHPFTNGTTVSLLSGIHFVNSTLDSLLIQHVSSIVFTGHPHEHQQLNATIDLDSNFTILRK